MPQYTVRDEASGRTITFDWAGADPPSETDMAEVFAAAGETPDAPTPSHDGQAEPLPEPPNAASLPLGEQAKWFAKKVATEGRTEPRAAIQAALATAPFTAGMSVPAAMAVTGGSAYLGERLAGEDRSTAAAQGVGQAALQGVGGGMVRAGQWVAGKGVPLVQSYLKPRYVELQHRAGIEGGTPQAVARRIAQFVIDHKLTTADKAGALVKASGQQVDDAIAKAESGQTPPVLDVADRIPRYLNAVLRRIEKQALPARDRTAVQNVGKELVEDSPLSRSTYRPPKPETLEAGLARGVNERMAIARNARQAHLKTDAKSQFTDPGGAYPRSVRPRELRTDVKPSEGMEIVRTKSFFDPGASGGQVAGGKAIERAVRDATKAAVPATRAPLLVQGRAMDAQRLLDRGEWLAGNRDTMGGLSQIMGATSGRGMVGLLMQMLKEGQLRAGIAAPGVGRAIARTGEAVPLVTRSLLSQLMASHAQD